jgi:hypothetical protein
MLWLFTFEPRSSCSPPGDYPLLWLAVTQSCVWSVPPAWQALPPFLSITHALTDNQAIFRFLPRVLCFVKGPRHGRAISTVHGLDCSARDNPAPKLRLGAGNKRFGLSDCLFVGLRVFSCAVPVQQSPGLVKILCKLLSSAAASCLPPLQPLQQSL